MSEKLTLQEQIAEEKRIAWINVQNYNAKQFAAKSPLGKLASIVGAIVGWIVAICSIYACLNGISL